MGPPLLHTRSLIAKWVLGPPLVFAHGVPALAQYEDIDELFQALPCGPESRLHRPLDNLQTPTR
ncbi:hypothetical protein D3C74_266750 [compost metagenome]